jgi:transcription elongation factor Elf1
VAYQRYDDGRVKCSICGRAYTAEAWAEFEHNPPVDNFKWPDPTLSGSETRQGYEIPVIGETTYPPIDWKCHNCGRRIPAGTACTAMEINGGSWQICPVCILDFRKRAGKRGSEGAGGNFQNISPAPNPEPVEGLPPRFASPADFTCPRCGGRTGRVNGGAICLSEACGASWSTRAEYESELDAYLDDPDAPPMTVDFGGVSTAELRHDLEALEQGYADSPMAEKLRAELETRAALPEDRVQALAQEITAVFEQIVQAATPERLEDILTWLKNLEVR